MSIKYLSCSNMGGSNLGWLRSIFHFSFADYHNHNNMNFGVLRVVNDDLIEPQTGFDMHPHKNMEIISYVIDGILEHKDNMGNASALHRGQVQYMSAGNGVMHSEYNGGSDICRLLQIWILPSEHGTKADYGDLKADFAARNDTWWHFVTSKANSALIPIKIGQDVNFFARFATKDSVFVFDVQKNRQAYLIQVEGESIINNITLNSQDALEIAEENIEIQAKKDAHFLIIEMQKSF